MGHRPAMRAVVLLLLSAACACSAFDVVDLRTGSLAPVGSVGRVLRVPG